MKKLSLLAVSLFLAGTAQAQIQPFTWVDGDLRDSAQNPVLDANVTIKATIKVNSCEVFAETHVKDLSTTNGHYAIKLGQGSPLYGLNSFSTAMDPTKGANCYPSGVTSNGIRTLTIQATLSNSDVITVPAFELGFAPSTTGVPEYLQTNSLAAPFHKFLNTAGTYGVQVNAPSGLTANYMLTLPNDAGTNGQVLTTDGAGVMSWSTPSGGTVNNIVGMAPISVSNSGGTFTISSTANGTVTALTAGTGLNVGAGPGGTITSSGTLNIDVGVTTGKIVQVGSSDKLPAIDSSNLTNLNASQLASGTMPPGRLPAFTGDVTSTPGSASLTLVTVPVNKGGTGVTTLPMGKLLAASALGTAVEPFNCAAGEVLGFDGTGLPQCKIINLMLNSEPPSSFRAESGNGAVYTTSGSPSFGTAMTVKNTAMATGSSSVLAFEVGNAGATVQKAWISSISNASGNAPTLAFGNSDNTNSYKEMMRITPQGVGIGTSGDPTANLQVRSAGGNASIGIDRAAGSSGSLVYTTANLKRWTAGVVGGTESGSNVGSAYAITSYDDTGNTPTNRITIERSTGGVGIGTTTPMAQLDVAGTTRFGTDGTPVVSMGACKITSGNFNGTPASFACNGLPATVNIAIACSPNQAIGATLIQCRATGVINDMSCWASGTANSIGVSCMWMRTQ